jgi:hypothetical protein
VKYSQASTDPGAPSIRWKVESTRQDREKGCPREYTHIHMGVHEDIETKNSIAFQYNGVFFI